MPVLSVFARSESSLPVIFRDLNFLCSIRLWLPTPSKAAPKYGTKYYCLSMDRIPMNWKSSSTSMSTLLGKFAQAMSFRSNWVGREIVLAFFHTYNQAVLKGYVSGSSKFPKTPARRVTLTAENLLEFYGECASVAPGHDCGLSFHMARPASTRKTLYNVSISLFPELSSPHVRLTPFLLWHL